MREALAARSDDDFIVEKPVRQARRRKAAAKPARDEPGLAATALMAVLRRPGTILATLLLSGCGGFIAYNALVLQKAHHPAPLFRSVVTEMPAAPASAAPLPPHRAAQEAAADALTAPERLATQAQPLVPPAPPSGVAAATTVAPVPPKPAGRSAIGDLIRNGGEVPPPAPARPAPAAAPQRTGAPDLIADMIRMGGPVPVPPANVGSQPDDRVTAAQRALVKLGYSVKVDGLAGPGTRQAIESFERDRRLAVTGELGPKTMRELSALSGLAIQ
ncbi:peptidoglycan-binding domain-containing protein [Microvirga pudoricolor]|uniref:peptidoglycan-binding domain-containing protein n=1 Tax=Microvirga pudoricolor TaxID=2778729 RepID=UPI001950EC4D|nr:peptidoglycan-binding domain-containing protein [Microvirga pudoricolor]MBM6592408.1 peptidoglycan-binding protein [Microvirga pudoricolor]